MCVFSYQAIRTAQISVTAAKVQKLLASFCLTEMRNCTRKQHSTLKPVPVSHRH